MYFVLKMKTMKNELHSILKYNKKERLFKNLNFKIETIKRPNNYDQ